MESQLIIGTSYAPRLWGFLMIYDRIADEAVWQVVGENEFTGKNASVKLCRQVESYFQSVETDFTEIHVIANESKVAINGTAAFSKDGKQLSFVSSCDVYEFYQHHQIINITSYYIQAI